MTKSFIQISDSHIDDNKLVMGVDSQANLSTIVSTISKHYYDALLISGDLAHNGTLESYQKLRKILNPIEAKIYVLPGNHDDLSNLSQIFNQSSLCNFIIGCWEIITIDSVQVGKVSGRLTDNNYIPCHNKLVHQVRNILLFVYITLLSQCKVIGMMKCHLKILKICLL